MPLTYDMYNYLLNNIRGDFTRCAAGFLFLDYDHAFNGSPSANGASSISTVATMLSYLRADSGHDDYQGAFLAA
jgi:hypothetical protein